MECNEVHVQKLCRYLLVFPFSVTLYVVSTTFWRPALSFLLNYSYLIHLVTQYFLDKMLQNSVFLNDLQFYNKNTDSDNQQK